MPTSSISCCPPRPTSSLFPGDRGSKSVLQREEHSWILEEREDLRPKAVDWWGDGGGGKSGEGRWEKGQPLAVNPAGESVGKCMASHEKTETGRPSPRPRPHSREGQWVNRAGTGRSVQIHTHLPQKRSD